MPFAGLEVVHGVRRGPETLRSRYLATWRGAGLSWRHGSGSRVYSCRGRRRKPHGASPVVSRSSKRRCARTVVCFASIGPRPLRVCLIETVPPWEVVCARALAGYLPQAASVLGETDPERRHLDRGAELALGRADGIHHGDELAIRDIVVRVQNRRIEFVIGHIAVRAARLPLTIDSRSQVREPKCAIRAVADSPWQPEGPRPTRSRPSLASSLL